MMIVTLLLAPIDILAVPTAPKYLPPTGLTIGQLKITGDEFIVIHNNSAQAISDLSNYWLYAFNKTNPNDAGASSSGEQLPAGRLSAGQTLLLSSKARATCGAEIAGDLGVSFGDSAGYLQLVKQIMANGSLTQTVIDSVSWSSGTSGTISKVPTNTVSPNGLYYRSSETANGWQLAATDIDNTCKLNAMISGVTSATAPVVSNLVQATNEPPAIIVSATSETADSDMPAGIVPAADIGLQAPQLTELLPNPSGTGNDETDEFIELYNPNNVAFDLSGFVLRSGLSTQRSYTFPVGTMLPAHEYKAFYSEETGLSLSNTASAVQLLDPVGNDIARSDSYATAKDGQSWARANGVWQWTLNPTPGLANIIKAPLAKTANTKNSKSKISKASNSATVASKSTGQKNNGKTTNFANTANTDSLQVTPIHSWTLAAAGLLAVAYGIYEYRLDLANRFYRLRKYYAGRRRNRQQT